MLYVPSMFIGQLSGSEGSNTASHNRYGSYFRNRTIPTNPRTPSQTLVRDALTSFSQNWKTLNAGEQSAWQQIADLVPIQNRQGQTITLSGQAFYVRFNLMRRSVGLARLDAAPAGLEVPPSFSALVADANGTLSEMNFIVTIVDGTASNFVTLWATPPLSPGRNFIKPSDYRLIGPVAGDTASPHNAATAYEVVFGTAWRAQLGMKISLKVFGVSDAGFQGEAVEAQGLIA